MLEAFHGAHTVWCVASTFQAEEKAWGLQKLIDVGVTGLLKFENCCYAFS